MNRSQAVRAAVLEAGPAGGDGLPPAPDRDELLALLGEAARAGSVSAMRALLLEQRRDGGDAPGDGELSFIEDLAERRGGEA
jgi:hypothetical protein